MSTMTCLRVVPAAVASARRAASPRASGAPGRALHAARARAPDAKVRSGPPETAPRLQHDRVRRAPLRPRRASSARPILPFSARRAARFPRPPVPAAPPDGKIYPFQFKPEPDAFRVPTLTPTRLPSSPSHSPALPSAASGPLARPLPGASPRFRRCARVLPRRRRKLAELLTAIRESRARAAPDDDALDLDDDLSVESAQLAARLEEAQRENDELREKVAELTAANEDAVAELLEDAAEPPRDGARRGSRTRRRSFARSTNAWRPRRRRWRRWLLRMIPRCAPRANISRRSSARRRRRRRRSRRLRRDPRLTATRFFDACADSRWISPRRRGRSTRPAATPRRNSTRLARRWTRSPPSRGVAATICSPRRRRRRRRRRRLRRSSANSPPPPTRPSRASANSRR